VWLLPMPTDAGPGVALPRPVAPGCPKQRRNYFIACLDPTDTRSYFPSVTKTSISDPG
jgi:hypothetical protein